MLLTGFVLIVLTLIDEAAAGASPKVAKCLAASVTTRTNGVNACTDGIRRGDAEWIYSAPSRNGLKSRREDLVHRVCAQPIGLINAWLPGVLRTDSAPAEIIHSESRPYDRYVVAESPGRC